MYVMGGVIGKAAKRYDGHLGSGQERTNTVLRLRPRDKRWTELEPMIEVRSTFVCTAWDGWIWACGSETSCEVMRPSYKAKSKWIEAPPMWRRRYRYEFGAKFKL